MDPFWLALGLKMLASAFLVVTAAAVVERAGPLVGALIATLPLSAGPAYVILAMEHDEAFMAATALTSMISAVASGAFVLIYVFAAQRWSMPASVGVALAGWVGAVLLIGLFDWTWPGLLALGLGLYGATLVAVRRYLRVSVARRPASRWYDAVLRGLLVMTLVGIVVAAGRAFGPKAAGIAAVVPLIFTSVAIVLQPRIGGPAAAAVLGNGLPGMAGFLVALVAVHVSATTIGTARALVLALAICVGWNLALLGYGLHRRRRRLGARSF